jgi:hypothetical protein
VALALAPISSTVFGNRRVAIYEATFDASYPAGGESLRPQDVGLRSIEFVMGSLGTYSNQDGTIACNVFFDYAASKLRVAVNGLAAPVSIPSQSPLYEVVANEDLDGLAARILVVGR